MLKPGENNINPLKSPIKKENIVKYFLIDAVQRISRIASEGSGALRTALPDTRMSAPASASADAFFPDTPPSTSIRHESPLRVISDFRAETLEYVVSMNFWPPKPANTDMISMYSQQSR